MTGGGDLPRDNRTPADRTPAGDPAPGDPATGDEPLRVSTLEIFFDLVFAFTLTQLTAVLASRLTWLTVAQVLLVFGLLWWMYEGYAWLTNSRPPAATAERLLLLVGMSGFLVIGIAIPHGFADYGVVLGLGYLLVVLVHAGLYYRVNSNILRVAPFNVASAVLVTIAGLLHGPAGTATAASYALWATALAVQLGSPLIVHPAGRFELRPSHFCERHNALVIIALGESIAAVGIGAADPASAGQVSWRLLAGAVLGLAVAAALWWIVFGRGDEERAEQVLTRAPADRRTALAMNAYFYGNIPLLLGLVALAAGVLREVVQAAGRPAPAGGTPASAGQAAVLACGAALFLTGNLIVRWRLGIGPARLRVLAAAAALATIPVGVYAGLVAQLALVAAVLVAPLVAEPPTAAGQRSARTARAADAGDGAG
jgi:low temperature requirement protein LtrA